jgi:hypothetical protein
MSQNLTQPEEVEHALSEMLGEVMKAGMPISAGAQLNGGIHGFECDWSIGSTSFSCGAVQNKSAKGLS